MGKINLTSVGGPGPYTITIREVNELSGNRYIGPNPTNNLTNLDVNFIKDNTAHLYSVKVSNGSCSDGVTIHEQTCPCEVVPSFVSSAVCSNPADPKISVTTSMAGGHPVTVQIFNASNVLIHNVTSLPGTQEFSVSNNNTYRITVASAQSGYENCKALDQVVNVSCTVPCSLTISVSNPSC